VIRTNEFGNSIQSFAVAKAMAVNALLNSSTP